MSCQVLLHPASLQMCVLEPLLVFYMPVLLGHPSCKVCPAKATKSTTKCAQGHISNACKEVAYFQAGHTTHFAAVSFQAEACNSTAVDCSYSPPSALPIAELLLQNAEYVSPPVCSSPTPFEVAEISASDVPWLTNRHTGRKGCKESALLGLFCILNFTQYGTSQCMNQRTCCIFWGHDPSHMTAHDSMCAAKLMAVPIIQVVV